MPLYSYACKECEKTEDAFRSIVDRDDAPFCCGRMARVFSAPMVTPDIAPYKSMIDGHMVMSRSEHRTHLRDHGMIEIGNEKQNMTRRPASPPGLKETIIEAAREKLRYT